MSKDIADLCPEIRSKCMDFIGDCIAQGIDARVIFTYRTPAEQDALYAQGRTAPGKRVTNLRGDKSKHCATLNGAPAARAFDIAIYRNGQYVAYGDDLLYKQAGAIGEARGLTWGGRWHDPHDPDHFEIA